MTTTVEKVRAILPAGSTLTDQQIQAAIDAAECTIERAEACMNGQGISDSCKDIICTYLAAHFAAVTDNLLSISSEADPCCGGSAKYGFKFGEGIMGTPFGQAANTMSGGCLAELDKVPANMFAIGCI